MVSIGDIFTSFSLGLLTPLTAVCVIPLYPGFLAYLANKLSNKANKKHYALLGLTITLGVILFMLLIGLIFTTILKVSLTNVIGIVSPIAFGILVIISLLLIFNIDTSKIIPKLNVKTIAKFPLYNALLYGFFFGAIVIPCNPAFIGALFARSFLITNFLGNILNFLFFGIGIGFPLLAFSLISARWSLKIIGFLTKNRRIINLVTGLIMLGISLYYLIVVFNVFGIF